MKLKTIDVNGQTYAVIQDNKPVYVDDDGKEVAFDAPATRATISRLNGESKGHREAKEAAEAKLKVFDGIDVEAAKKAIDTVKNIEDKKLIDAGQAETVKAELKRSYEDKIASMERGHAAAIETERTEKSTLQKAWHDEKLTNAFNTSKTITDKFAIPADLVQSRFGANFKIEESRLVGYDNAGNKLYSRARPAELATFDEAIDMLVDQYPHKDSILKGRGGGSGSGGNGGRGANGKTISRAEYEKNPGAYTGKLREGYALVD